MKRLCLVLAVCLLMLSPCRAARADEQAEKLLAGVSAPDVFDVTLFAAPTDVSYPVCLTAAADGTVFVGVDQNGSLDREKGRGWVVRCVDEDADGKAEKFTTFCKVDSPRGLIWDDGTLYVMHPPDLSAYHDDDGDGVADRKETLVKGLGFGLDFRGADHTTNGIVMGIDGFIYVAVGDYGFVKAVGADGRELQLRGGGIVRVRPDGSQMEIYARGLRNVCDFAIDPLMRGFTRDNTNDGGGWDVRLSQIVQSANYGYPSLYKHFNDEIMPPLADYGGGSGTGALYISEPTLPREFGDTLYTVDWGRNEIYTHPLTANGATVKAQQQRFMRIDRPTDMAVDAMGNVYVASWKGGQYKYAGPNVGFIVRLKAKAGGSNEDGDEAARGEAAKPMPVVKKLDLDGLVALLRSPSHVRRLAASRELVRRGRAAKANGDTSVGEAVTLVALDEDAPLNVRVAALFTSEQVMGEEGDLGLSLATQDAALRPYALRAWADRGEAKRKRVPIEPFLAALTDKSATTRLAAIIGLGRLGRPAIGDKLLPFTIDADPAIAHTAVKALVSLAAADACLAEIDRDSKLATGAFRALREMHEPAVVSGLIERLERTDHPHRQAVIATLIRLYHQEGDYTRDWWGTRPDTTGPYYKRATWAESGRIAEALRDELGKADADGKRFMLNELHRHRVELGDTTALLLKMAKDDASFAPQAIELLVRGRDVPAEALPLLKETALSPDAAPAARVQALEGLQRMRGDEAEQAAIEALVAFAGAAEPAKELLRAREAFVRDRRRLREVDTFVAMTDQPDAGRNVLAYAVLLNVSRHNKVNAKTVAAAQRAIGKAWSTPGSATSLLQAIRETNSDGYALQVRAQLEHKDIAVRTAAAQTARALDLLDDDKPTGPTIGAMTFDAALAAIEKRNGDRRVGEKLFTKLGCVACHTVSPNDPPKGPMLAGITERYSRKEIVQSILEPSAVIAQGFESKWYLLDDGSTIEGFAVQESADEVELRTIAGLPHVIDKAAIVEERKPKSSMMPADLAKDLTAEQLAGLVAYLESLKTK